MFEITFLQNFEGIVLLFSNIQCCWWEIQWKCDSFPFVDNLSLHLWVFKVFSLCLVFGNFTRTCLGMKFDLLFDLRAQYLLNTLVELLFLFSSDRFILSSGNFLVLFFLNIPSFQVSSSVFLELLSDKILDLLNWSILNDTYTSVNTVCLSWDIESY